MRIAVLTNAYPPEARGGAGRIASLQVEMLKTAGHEVRVWHPAIKWFGAPAPVRLFRHLLDLRPRKDLVVEIAAWNPDVLITHNLTGCGFATPRKIQRRNVRWIQFLHDVQLFEPSGQLASAENISLWQRAWSALRRRALGQPDLVLSPTQWLLDEHRRRGFFPSVPKSVLLNPAQAIVRLERKPHVPLRLLYVGRVSDDKGADIIAGLSVELKIPYELHLVGHGPALEELKATSPTVISHGELGPDGVRERMEEADVLLVPSQIEENQPTVILEAASVGLPVVASDSGGIRETLDEAGILCPSENLSAWVAAVQSLADPSKYAKAVEDMYRLAEKYQPKNIAERLLESVGKHMSS